MDDVNNATRIPEEKHTYEALNWGLTIKWNEFWRAHLDSTSLIIDTEPIFNEALDSPAKIGMKNATCWGGSPDQGCVWADDFHPGPELHHWIAEHVAELASPVFGEFFS
jgi:phospholipase/lecithinase/hemolysin